MIIEQVYRELSAGFRVVFTPQWSEDYFDLPLSLEEFVLVASDYEMPRGTIVCPCGERLLCLDGYHSVASAVEASVDHAAVAHGKRI